MLIDHCGILPVPVPASPTFIHSFIHSLHVKQQHITIALRRTRLRSRQISLSYKTIERQPCSCLLVQLLTAGGLHRRLVGDHRWAATIYICRTLHAWTAFSPLLSSPLVSSAVDLLAARGITLHRIALVRAGPRTVGAIHSSAPCLSITTSLYLRSIRGTPI